MSNTKDREDLSKITGRLLDPAVNFEESQELYRQWNKEGTYDKMMNTGTKNYAALAMLKQASDKYFKDRENQLILDVGAGTGLSGQVLREIGFKKLHALEPLQEFVDETKKKGIYSHFLVETIGGKPTSAKNDTYDGIVSSGAFGPGHIPCDAINEMIRIVKPGGYIIIAMRHEFTWTVEEYKDRLEPLMKLQEEKGKWRQILREIYEKHFLNLDGILFVYQVC